MFYLTVSTTNDSSIWKTIEIHSTIHNTEAPTQSNRGSLPALAALMLVERLNVEVAEVFTKNTVC